MPTAIDSSSTLAAAHDPTTPSLALVDTRMRLRLHLMAAVAVIFLSIYGKVVCPFVDSVVLWRLVLGLCAVGLAQILLREVLYGLFPRPWGRTTLARHGMLIALLSWVVAGIVAMGLHMVLYPDFPLGSHVKLLTGYWALGGGILSQLEFNLLERYLRRRAGPAVMPANSSEHITRRLMESYAVFTAVPALILILAVFRQVHEGYGSLPEALEVTFIGIVFVAAALVVAWRYGVALHEDCADIRSALADVSQGNFRVSPDLTRADELGLVARGITEMGEDLAQREQRELQLLRVTSAFSQELHLDRLLAVITNGATELLNAERSSLFLYDAGRDQLWTRVAEGLSDSPIYLPKDGGLAGSCFMQQTVINIADVRQDPRFNAETDRATGFVTRNMLCMPVNTREGKELGVIQVLNRREGAFDERDEQRLLSLAAQAATALDNAQLFDEVLNLKNHAESVLKSLSNGVVAMDPDLKVTRVNAVASRILGWEEAEVRGRALPDLLSGSDAWLVGAVDKAVDGQQAEYALDVDIHGHDEQAIAVNLNVVPLSDINESFMGTLLVLEDLSAEKRVRTTMSRYMSKAVVDQVLDEHREVLTGQSQTMTLLFTDIRSFTTISEAIGAQATVEMLNSYFTDMVEVIDAHDGILDKYIGDAIMALFGVPFAGERDERNALDAANGMMHALERFNALRARSGHAPIMHGIGINTGEAVAGNIGSPKRMDYTVIGDAVNLTARIEGTTKFYGAPVLLSGQTLERLGATEHIREVDRIRVKGKTEPVTLYESYAWRAQSLTDAQMRAITLGNDALAAFRALAFEQADEMFGEAQRSWPEQKLPGIYRERIKFYRNLPPPPDWDGVWTMTSK